MSLYWSASLSIVPELVLDDVDELVELDELLDELLLDELLLEDELSTSPPQPVSRPIESATANVYLIDIPLEVSKRKAS